MRTRLLMSLAIFAGLLPLAAAADHDCIEEKPYGEKIERKERLPREWLMLNDKVVSDISLHAELRSRYKKAYRSSSDGTGGALCLHTGKLYINVSKYDSGSWFEFSTRAPKCWKCTFMRLDLDHLAPGSGLRIGQTKAQVSAILGVSIRSDVDIVTMTFEEIERGPRTNRLHTESLRVEFRADKLISFYVSENWEDA